MRNRIFLQASVVMLLVVMCQSQSHAALSGSHPMPRKSPPRPASTAQAPCPPDFYGVELGAFPNCYDYWTKQKLSLVTLSQYETGGAIYLAGSFQPGGKRRARWGMTKESFEKLNNSYVASGEGWRVDQVNVLTTDQGQFFAAIWVEDLKRAWLNDNMMTQPVFDKNFSERGQQGMNMVDVASYRAREVELFLKPYMDVRWSGVWLGPGSAPSAVHDNMTLAGFNNRDKKYQAEGFQVTRFITYRGDSRQGSPLLHAAIWRPKNALPAGTWRAMPTTTFPEFQKMYNALGPQGYRLYYINVFEDVVSAVWVKPFILKVPGR